MLTAERMRGSTKNKLFSTELLSTVNIKHWYNIFNQRECLQALHTSKEETWNITAFHRFPRRTKSIAATLSRQGDDTITVKSANRLTSTDAQKNFSCPRCSTGKNHRVTAIPTNKGGY